MTTSTSMGDKSHRSGRPSLGERALTPAERKRQSRKATNTPTAERLRADLFDVFTREIDQHCRGHRTAEPTCNEVIEIVSAKYPVEQRSRIAQYLGWPRHSEDNPDLMTISY